ncbi:MAG: hypothetical protein HQK53_11070 [Oligoflexia bacterium]|nr:hypothetical protein [Oligoflexia bacterium]
MGLRLNLFLLSLLILLLVITYYLVEKPKLLPLNQQERDLQQLAYIFSHSSLSRDSIIEIGWGNTVITQQQFTKLADADKKKLTQFLKKLGDLQVIRVFSAEEVAKANREDFFPQKLTGKKFHLKLADHTIHCQLGNRVAYAEGMYLEITHDEMPHKKDSTPLWAVVADQSTYTGVYFNEEQLRDEKYRWWLEFQFSIK